MRTQDLFCNKNESMVWNELSACEIHFGASTKFLEY